MASAVQIPEVVKPLTRHRRSLDALTGIRFFAAGYVVVFHTQVGTHLVERGHAAAGNFFLNGQLAVPLFFILSGFILAYTYRGQIETAGDHRRFWEARIARIWPAYLVSLVAMSLPSLVFPPWWAMLSAVFMVQAWDPWFLGLAGTWNYVCWTLSCEAFFYLLFPFVQVWLERLGTRLQALFTVAALAVCVGINSGVRGIGYPEVGFFEHIPLPVLHLFEFLVGVGLGNLFLRALDAGAAKLPGRGAVTYVAAIASIVLLTRPQSGFTSVVVVAFAALVYGLAAETTALARLLGSPAGVLGGGISYAMYLMQLPVKAWVVAACDAAGLKQRDAVQVVTGVVLLLVSFGLYKAVENPARKVLRGVFARLA